MEIERIAQVLIYYIHAPLGGIALLAGGVALIAKKGSQPHKKSGKVFFYSMLFSALTALIISLWPNHESTFLFAIGLFTTYFLISGIRSLKYKRETELLTDKIIAYGIVLTGLLMILYPLLWYGDMNIVLTIFGAIGILFGQRDVRLLKDAKQLKKNWLRLHLGKMTAGYIAAFSAFFVVNGILPGVWNWFLPGIIGSAYIAFWIMKLNKKTGSVQK